MADINQPARANKECVPSPDGNLIAAFSDDGDKILLIDSQTGKNVKAIPYTPASPFTPAPSSFPPGLTFSGYQFSPLGQFFFSPNSQLLIAGQEEYFVDKSGLVSAFRHFTGIFDLRSGERIQLYERGGDEFFSNSSIVFSPNGEIYLLQRKEVISLLSVHNGKEVSRIADQNLEVAAFTPDSRYILTAGLTDTTTVYMSETATGKEVRRFTGHSHNVTSVAVSPDGHHLLTASKDHTERLWDIRTGEELCRLVTTSGGDWVVITPDGRFDTNNLEGIQSLSWLMPDDPFTPLPLEIFMRQYYEPRLLVRTLAGEKFKPVPPLTSLNRSQPEVIITKVEPQINAPDQVSVTVKVACTEKTKVYDLRLFRNGQLVGSRLHASTDTSENVSSAQSPEAELNAWRRASEISLDSSGKAIITFSHIKLPHQTDIKQVEFSAYAFNVDKVKSATDRRTFDLPKVITSRKGRAYIITVGVNAYENTDFDLEFAADDARRMQQVMSDRLAATRQYEEIIPVSLVSDYEVRDGQKVTTLRQATKENFHIILQLLSNKSKTIDPKLLTNIPHADQLREATPDDLVVIMYSSHGYADRDGNFYFIPYDTGPGTGKVFTQQTKEHSISSEELSLWLRDVDAGEMVMIVDACHSAAAIEGKEFKPGPMGSRGLGQLSYDKGMRILTATQSDNIALENNLIKQGLLTYALIRDGIEALQADYRPKDHVVNIGEWLSYGVERVPKLYEEVQAGKVQNFGRGAAQQTKVVMALQSGKSGSKALEEVAVEAKAQQPSLFDFARKRREVTLVK